MKTSRLSFSLLFAALATTASAGLVILPPPKPVCPTPGDGTPQLTISGDADKVTVSWNGLGILHRSSSLQNWGPLYNTTTPYSFDPGGGASNFRVEVPLPPCPGSIFDLTSVPFRSSRNHTSASFSAQFNDWVDDCYRVIDIEAYADAGTIKYGAVWQRNIDGRNWITLRGMTSAQFSDKWTHYRDLGYRLLDQEAYLTGNGMRYAGVWEQNVEGVAWASFRNLTSAQFSANFAAYKDDYTPIDVEGYWDGDELRYSVIWVQGCDIEWRLYRDLDSAGYSAKFTQFGGEGFRVAKFCSYRTAGGSQRYAAIWLDNTSSRAWLMLRDMTSAQYGDKWTEYRDAGYRLVDFEAYDTAGGTRYAGVWRKNN